jgi:tripartite-type tricarboxylate transporter receptor subunit TctC
MKRVRSVVRCAAGAVRAGTGGAQVWPAKSVKIVVPFAAGGATDIIARQLAQKLTDAWGQRVWWRTGRARAAISARTRWRSRLRTAIRC